MMCAFGNFFLIMNGNTTGAISLLKEMHPTASGEEDYRYVAKYLGNDFFDALISMWLLGTGEFNTDNQAYSKGPYKALAYFFFLLATFVVLIVFMNMLIAIMGETFAEVTTG